MVMARYRRMALRPINRIKHVIDNAATLTAGTALNVFLVTADDSPTLANTTEVETGSSVNGIYLRVEVASTEAEDIGAIPNVYMIVTKNPGGNITVPTPNAVGSNDNKRFVIHQEMVMIQNARGGNSRTLFNGVIAIPKGYRRFAPNDTLLCTFLSPQVNIAVCVQCHYKEFR